MRFLPKLVRAEATIPVPVGTAATSEGALRELDPVAAAAFGISTDDSGPLTRRQAMAIPAVRRGRNMIAGTVGTFPLVCRRFRGDGTVEAVERPLLAELDPTTTPAYTLTWLVDDLFFYGISWLRVTSRDADGFPRTVEWLSRHRLLVDYDAGRVWVDGKLVDDADLIRVDGPDEGLLASSGDTLRLARALAKAAKRTADDDWSGIVLRLAEGAAELTDDEVTALLDSWETAKARRSTPYINRAVEPHSVGYDAQARQLTELHQLVDTELARAMNMPASAINAPQGSGMTYSNTEAERRDRVDTTFGPYLTAVAQRLSLDDVTPHGQRVSFDVSAYLRGDLVDVISAGVQAVQARIASRAEARRMAQLPVHPDVDDTIDPAPAAPATPPEATE